MPKTTVTKKVKGWAVCFSLNEKCLQGNILTFRKKREAAKYIIELHARIGGFEEDHHIIPVEISYTLPIKSKKK